MFKIYLRLALLSFVSIGTQTFLFAMESSSDEESQKIDVMKKAQKVIQPKILEFNKFIESIPDNYLIDDKNNFKNVFLRCQQEDALISNQNFEIWSKEQIISTHNSILKMIKSAENNGNIDKINWRASSLLEKLFPYLVEKYNLIEQQESTKKLLRDFIQNPKTNGIFFHTKLLELLLDFKVEEINQTSEIIIEKINESDLKSVESLLNFIPILLKKATNHHLLNRLFECSYSQIDSIKSSVFDSIFPILNNKLKLSNKQYFRLCEVTNFIYDFDPKTKFKTQDIKDILQIISEKENPPQQFLLSIFKYIMNNDMEFKFEDGLIEKTLNRTYKNIALNEEKIVNENSNFLSKIALCEFVLPQECVLWLDNKISVLNNKYSDDEIQFKKNYSQNYKENRRYYEEQIIREAKNKIIEEKNQQAVLKDQKKDMENTQNSNAWVRAYNKNVEQLRNEKYSEFKNVNTDGITISNVFDTFVANVANSDSSAKIEVHPWQYKTKLQMCEAEQFYNEEKQPSGTALGEFIRQKEELVSVLRRSLAPIVMTSNFSEENFNKLPDFLSEKLKEQMEENDFSVQVATFVIPTFGQMPEKEFAFCLLKKIDQKNNNLKKIKQIKYLEDQFIQEKINQKENNAFKEEKYLGDQPAEEYNDKQFLIQQEQQLKISLPHDSYRPWPPIYNFYFYEDLKINCQKIKIEKIKPSILILEPLIFPNKFESIDCNWLKSIKKIEIKPFCQQTFQIQPLLEKKNDFIVEITEIKFLTEQDFIVENLKKKFIAYYFKKAKKDAVLAKQWIEDNATTTEIKNVLYKELAKISNSK